MFRSVRPYLGEAGIEDPVVCYQGALVADPVGGSFLLHRPLDLELAREVIAFLDDAGYSPNVYVDDDLYVARQTERTRAYAEFQHLPVTEVGDLLAWLERPPTKLVVVDDPARLQALRAAAWASLGERLFLTTSLPHFLELGQAGVSKGSGLADVCARLGIPADRVVAFGDGENDVELFETAAFGVAVENGHVRLLEIADATCPPPERDGVARMMDAYLTERVSRVAP